jgi:hypothetical protein
MQRRAGRVLGGSSFVLIDPHARRRAGSMLPLKSSAGSDHQ